MTEADLASTNVALRFELSPVKNIIGDLSGLIGSFSDELLGAFFSRNTGRRANVVITELFDNAVVNNLDNESNIVLDLKKGDGCLHIQVSNKATTEQFEQVKDHVDMINGAKDRKRLLADTINARRKDRLRGGLGLMRLVVENKFDISVSYKKSMICVTAEMDDGGTQ